MVKRGLLLVLLLAAATGCGQVDTGEGAIFKYWGVMDDKCYGPGFYSYNPIAYDMDEVNLRTRTYAAKKLTAATGDIQEVHADVTVNYVIDPTNCHKTVAKLGHTFDHIVGPAVDDALKAATAHFPIDKIIKDRKQLSQEFKAALQEKLAAYFLIIESVNLTDFGVSPDFAKAVERKQIAEQKVQEKEYERQQAEREKAKAILVAEGQADANRKLADSLRQSPETIEFRRLEVREKEIAKWNGVLPTTIFGTGTVPIVTVK